MRKQLGMEGETFFATGVSIVFHPKHPRHPIIHMNVRYFELNTGVYWFGGGIDLTPHYVNEEAAKLFHIGLKSKCDSFHSNFYTEFKPWADRYFYLPHRNESRGIGGIFFDHFNTGKTGHDMSMVKDLSEHFIESYFPIVKKRMSENWTEDDEDFMLHRRGRYVEFNLLHDRGTLFGLKTNGRVDSILISLPARCKFTYQYRPAPGSLYEKMWKYYTPHPW
jgi:coproporphyrinogen III oxidase